MAIAALGYVRLEMQDPAAWLGFGEQVLGFAAGAAPDGAVRLRMDGAPFRYLIERAEADRFAAAGWECRDRAEYQRLLAALAAADALTGQGSQAEAASRAVTELAFAVDPSGNALELYYGRTGAGGRFTSPIAGAAFITDPMGLGHIVIPAPAFEATDAFYRNVLGFAISDELTLPPPAEGAPEQRVHFLHADNPRHHSLGLFNFPAPNGIVHVMAETTTLDSVGSCLDRVKAAGLPVVATLGRHWNDNMVSFYFLAPGGIPIEFGYDGRRHDWSSFQPTKGTIGDVWGHEYNFPS